MKKKTQDVHKQSAAPADSPVACAQCGANAKAALVERVEVMVAGKRTPLPMCHRCAAANRAALKAFGGTYLSISAWGGNRAARRQQAKPAPIVKAAKTRRATRGERRAAKKADAAKRKQVAA